jgi:hypothetical protein
LVYVEIVKIWASGRVIENSPIELYSQIEFDRNRIKLTWVNTDTPVTRSFERIRRFP